MSQNVIVSRDIIWSPGNLSGDAIQFGRLQMGN